jgi:DNA-binding LacI/PurR family transcriptional regulator
LAYIAGTANATTNQDRWKGFSERCAELGITDLHEKHAHLFSYDAGYQAALRLHDRDPRPDAIFCANDILALGALEALRGELGLNVPDDVSLAGFDNILMSGWPSHSLTTYHYPVQRMIAQTIELIERISAEPDYEPVSVVIHGHLVVRESTRNTPHPSP